MADAVDDVLADVAADLTPLLRNHAMEMGWPEKVASMLSMEVTEVGGLRPTWDKENEQAVMAQELGNESRAPRAALHSWSKNPVTQRHMSAIAISKMTRLVRQVDRGLR